MYRTKLNAIDFAHNIISVWFRTKLAYNKAFKSDSLRLLVSLRSQYGKRASHLNAALCDSEEKWKYQN